jgi:hypothetical protein
MNIKMSSNDPFAFVYLTITSALSNDIIQSELSTVSRQAQTFHYYYDPLFNDVNSLLKKIVHIHIFADDQTIRAQDKDDAGYMAKK